MLLVIFGAGASFDSVKGAGTYGLAREEMPPLANDLFAANRFTNEVVARHPTAQPLIAQMRELALTGGDVEVALKEFQDEAEIYPDRRRHLMGVRFYLRDIMDQAASRVREKTAGITNYSLLVDTLRRWSVRTRESIACVTFNYDTLLEDAVAASFDREFKKVDDYLDGEWLIFKPHGSTTWLQGMRWVAGVPPVTGVIDVQKSAASVEPGQIFVHRGQTLIREQGVGWAPGLAVPLADKSAFACPPHHLARLKDMIPHVERLLIVGWRAREPHFQEWLAQLGGGVRTLAVAEAVAAANATLRNLPVNARRNASVWAGGFSTLSGAEELHNLLYAG